jgi:hypothetical protein
VDRQSATSARGEPTATEHHRLGRGRGRRQVGGEDGQFGAGDRGVGGGEPLVGLGHREVAVGGGLTQPRRDRLAVGVGDPHAVGHDGLGPDGLRLDDLHGLVIGQGLGIRQGQWGWKVHADHAPRG